MHKTQQQIQQLVLDDISVLEYYDVDVIFWKQPHLIQVDDLLVLKVDEFDFLCDERRYALITIDNLIFYTKKNIKIEELNETHKHQSECENSLLRLNSILEATPNIILEMLRRPSVYFSEKWNLVSDLEQSLCSICTQVEALAKLGCHEPGTGKVTATYDPDVLEHHVNSMFEELEKLKALLLPCIKLKEGLQLSLRRSQITQVELQNMHIAQAVAPDLAVSLESTYNFVRTQLQHSPNKLQPEHQHYVRLCALLMALTLFQQASGDTAQSCAQQCLDVYTSLAL